jgi:YVTN family beta-propeller protein
MMMKRFVRGFALMMVLTTVVGLAFGQQTSRLYTLPTAGARFNTSASMAFVNDGRLLVTANMLNNTVSVVDPGQAVVLSEIAVGKDPRTITVTPDNARAVVVNRGDGTVSVIDLVTQSVSATYPVGTLPYGIVSADNETAYIALQGEDAVVRLDLNSGTLTDRLKTGNSPAGLALWGDLLYVSHLWSGDLSLIYLPQLRVIETVAAGEDTALSQSIAIDTQRGLAYLPQTRLNTQNRSLTFDTTVFPVVNVFDLTDLSAQHRAQLTLDTADRPVNMPFAAVIDGQRRWLYVANAGSNDVSVIDLTSGLGVNHIPVGANPRTLLLSRNAGTLYVHNMIEGTITLVDTNTFAIIDDIPVSVLNIPSDVYIGAQLFHTSADPRLSADEWISCASCHFDGQSDGRVWLGYIEGPRNTPLLYNLADYPFYNAGGSWDEVADVELKIRDLQAGTGLIEVMPNPPLGDPHSGLSPDLDTLTAYLFTLQGPAAPKTSDVAQIERGQQLFEELNCASCHAGAAGIDGQRHDVGTGGEFVTPTLRWLWLSAPYFHDGSAPELIDVFIMPGAHQLIQTVPFEEIEALVSYLNMLPTS